MRLGDVLGGYRIVTEPTNANAGMSQWAKAEQGGVTYFMKRFLAPKYPTPSSPGTPEGHERRRRDCEAFERRQLAIIERLSGSTTGASHLITPKVFFRVGPSYFKVTDLVDIDQSVSLASCTPEDVAIAIRSLIVSVDTVHGAGVVHSDLKPDNVLFERTRGGRLACKLIDFDESYVTGEPPPVMRLAGDPYFYSPEMLSYVRQLDSIHAHDLTTASDTFALGILLHMLVTGATLGMGQAYTYPCEAVQDQAKLVLHPALGDHVVGRTLTAMLSRKPQERPSIGEVLHALGRDQLIDAIDATRSHPTGVAHHPAPPLAVEAEDSNSTGHHGAKSEANHDGAVMTEDDHVVDAPQPAGNGQPDGARLRFNMGRRPPTD